MFYQLYYSRNKLHHEFQKQSIYLQLVYCTLPQLKRFVQNSVPKTLQYITVKLKFTISPSQMGDYKLGWYSFITTSYSSDMMGELAIKSRTLQLDLDHLNDINGSWQLSSFTFLTKQNLKQKLVKFATLFVFRDVSM